MTRHLTPKIIDDVTVEPITLEEARAHLEAQAYEDSDVDPIDDAMIEGWISAAREFCEDFTGLTFATKTLEIAIDRWPTVALDGSTQVELPGGPVREIIEIMISTSADYTSDDVDSDVAAGEDVYADGQVNPDLYLLDTHRQPPRITPVTSWPVVTEATNAIRIRYLAGYGVDSDGGEALPKVMRAALLLVLGHLYANRESTTDKVLQEVPMGVTSLLRPRRVRLGMA